MPVFPDRTVLISGDVHERLAEIMSWNKEAYGEIVTFSDIIEDLLDIAGCHEDSFPQ